MADSLDEAIEAKFGHKKPAKFETNSKNHIKHIIGVVSGKGGVGKSFVTSMLAVSLAKRGYKVGILDSDITGPSIPKAFGTPADVKGDKELMYPPVSKKGIKIMSINLMLENETEPVLWRGPVLGNVIRQFYCDTLWSDLDFLLIDMPPGTGDVALTVFQSIPVDGVVLVSTPQDLVKMIVGKAVTMCDKMDVEILGLVENMSYMTCSCCNNKIYPFGKSKLMDVADAYQIDPLGALPINPEFADLVDKGQVEDIECDFMDEITDKLINNVEF
ncbi:MAG: Mrp/NBP35 family ATP-binding protein [Acholeplasmatales bacterium]|nr:Mrp/NBP35 family ATP-binding protein [Acholeplasmatales bacterium]